MCFLACELSKLSTVTTFRPFAPKSKQPTNQGFALDSEKAVLANDAIALLM